MKRLLSIVTLLVTLALTGQSQQVLWSRHFMMQPNVDTAISWRKNATFTSLVKNGNHFWASVSDDNLSKSITGTQTVVRASSIMTLGQNADSITYTNLNCYGYGLDALSPDRFDSNSVWAVPIKGDDMITSSPNSLNLYKVNKLGVVTKHIEFFNRLIYFIPIQAITTLDSGIVVVGSMIPDARFDRYDMFAAKFHINGQLKWLNTYNTHVPDVRTYSVNLVGQDSLVVTAFWGRSVFNTYIDKDGYVYDNKVIWNDPGRRLVDKMRLLPTPDGGYFLIGDIYMGKSYWHKMDHNFNVQWSDSTYHGGLANMMISADHTFTMFLTNLNGKTGGSSVPDTLFYVRRRLDNSVLTLSKWPYSVLPLSTPGYYKGAVLTGNNSAVAVGATNLQGFGNRVFPSIFRIFGVGEPYNPGPLSTPGVAQKAGQPYLYPNPLVSGWQVAGISPDAGTAATLTWYDAQGRMLGSQLVMPGVAQPEVPKVRGVLFYRLTWQEQGLKMASGKVVVE